ncbi:MAG: hypothetical protein WCP45_14155, partial [Verrucomicrobiota bacterium]
MMPFPAYIPVALCSASRLGCGIGLLALMGLGVRPVAAAPLTRIAEIRTLARTAANEGMPVKVRGVVTWPMGASSMTIQDESGGIWVDLALARNRQLWRSDDAIFGKIRVGSELEIDGRVYLGGYAPTLLPESLRILGVKPLPVPAPMDPPRFFSGAEDGEFVEAGGVVQRVMPSAGGDFILSIDANPGVFTVRIFNLGTVTPGALVDAEVRVIGVATTRFNTRGETTGVRITANLPDSLRVVKPAPLPEAVPSVTLDCLLPFSPEARGPHRVRVAGTVTYTLPGKFLYLQEGNYAVRVETTSTLALKPGDRVEVDGFVILDRCLGMLGEASIRMIGVGRAPEAVAITPVEIFAAHQAATQNARSRFSRDYDGQLIRCRARLLAVESGPDGNALRTLVLE